MSLLTTPDLPTAYSSDQLTDHQTCPSGCSPAAAASHSVQLSPTQCLGRYQESKAGCSLGCFSRYLASSNNFCSGREKGKVARVPYSSKSSQQKLKQFGAKVNCKEKLSICHYKNIHKQDPSINHYFCIKQELKKKIKSSVSLFLSYPRYNRYYFWNNNTSKVSPKFTGFGTSWFWSSCCTHATSQWSVQISFLISDILRAIQREKIQNHKGQHGDWRKFRRQMMRHEGITPCHLYNLTQYFCCLDQQATVLLIITV